MEWVADTFRPAAQALIMKWEAELEDLKSDGNNHAAAKLGKKLNGLKRFAEKINLFLNSAAENITDWIVYTDETKGSDTFGCMIVKPLTATLFADEILFSKAEKVIIMSATIGDFKFFMRNLGIDPNDAVTCRIECDFPVENRPVFLKPIANMSSTKVACPDCSTPEDSGRENRKGTGCRRCYNSGQVPSIDVAMPKVADFLGQIMDKFSSHKGIVHTHSYKVNRFMSESMNSRNRVLTHTSVKGDRDAAIVRHIESEEPTVLFSPSMTEGLDLKDELSRFSVICKVPFPYLDPYVKARMQRDPEWYASRVALALVQATGRSNRHKEDKAKHFILDSAIINFLSRYAKLFPKWWMDAVVWPD
jgi:Rad3-related DNA helicase